MKSLKLVTLFSIFLAMSGCASSAWTYLAADEDEDYGIGGTGIVAQNTASEAVGVVGEITGFGSIFVNGIRDRRSRRGFNPGRACGYRRRSDQRQA
jgi:hypothetical protein